MRDFCSPVPFCKAFCLMLDIIDKIQSLLFMVLDTENHSAVGKGRIPQHLCGKLQSEDYDQYEYSAWLHPLFLTRSVREFRHCHYRVQQLSHEQWRGVPQLAFSPP